MRLEQKPTRAILIHGNAGASVNGIWFPYLKAELENLGVEVIARDFPDPIKGRQRYWLPFLRDELEPDENTLLIGHSSGALASMRLAETHRIFGSVLVAAQLTDCGYELEKRSGFFDTPYDWEQIKANQNWIIQFHSVDDPWIDVNEARSINGYLDSDYHEMEGYGHFGSYEQQMIHFPELIRVLTMKFGIINQ